VITGIASVWLTVKENIWCWPIGIVNVLLYVVVFREQRLYVSMALQIVYFVLNIYGWWEWRHGGEGGGALQVSRTPLRWLVGLGLAGAAGTALLGWVLRAQTDAAVPFWDSALGSFSIVAQWMQTKKWLESWHVWIAVDVVSVGVYLVQGLALTSVLYAVFLGLAVAGLLAWRRSMAAAAAGTA